MSITAMSITRLPVLLLLQMIPSLVEATRGNSGAVNSNVLGNSGLSPATIVWIGIVICLVGAGLGAWCWTQRREHQRKAEQWRRIVTTAHERVLQDWKQHDTTAATAATATIEDLESARAEASNVSLPPPGSQKKISLTLVYQLQQQQHDAAQRRRRGRGKKDPKDETMAAEEGKTPPVLLSQYYTTVQEWTLEPSNEYPGAWTIAGHAQRPPAMIQVGMGDNNKKALSICSTRITEGLLTPSGHAYWVEEEEVTDDNNKAKYNTNKKPPNKNQVCSKVTFNAPALSMDDVSLSSALCLVLDKGMWKATDDTRGSYISTSNVNATTPTLVSKMSATAANATTTAAEEQV